MNMYYISFSKWTPGGTIRATFAIRHTSRPAARTIAEREIKAMSGYTFAGCD